jgi:hypothetical protein
VPPVSLSLTFVVVGAGVTRNLLLNVASLPLLRAGVACLSGSGTVAADVTATSTIDLILAPGDVAAVSAGYAGNLARPSPTACAAAGSNSANLPLNVVIPQPSDQMVAISVAVSVRVPAAVRRQLQASASALAGQVAGVGGGSVSAPSALALQLAAVLAALGTALGPDGTSFVSANAAGAFNFSNVAAQAVNGGLPPPTPAILAQLGAWLVALGPGIQVSQLPSIVMSAGGVTTGVPPQTAVVVGGAVLKAG